MIKELAEKYSYMWNYFFIGMNFSFLPMIFIIGFWWSLLYILVIDILLVLWVMSFTGAFQQIQDAKEMIVQTSQATGIDKRVLVLSGFSQVPAALYQMFKDKRKKK
jgi:hypothetical protein